MRTSPAQLIVAACVAALFDFAGAASHTRSDALSPSTPTPRADAAVAVGQVTTPSTPSAQP
jgi:hypothetical protein